MRPIALLLISIFGTAFARCTIGSVQGVGRDDCFKLSLYADTWYGAEDNCRSKGGHLASVSSAFTNALLRDQFALRSAPSYWLGGSEGSSYGSWSWSDGTWFFYTNWARGEPDNATALCLAASSENGQWSSQACYDLKPYICKLPAVQDGNLPSCATPAPPKTTCSSNNVTCPQLTCPPPPPAPTCSYNQTEKTPTLRTTTPSGYQRCGYGWTYSDVTMECWMLYYTNYDWFNAANGCAQSNAAPISIHSPEANHAAAVFAQMNDINDTIFVWLGLRYANAHWQWVDHSAYSYENWSSTEENYCEGTGKDCYGAMSFENSTNFGKWTSYYPGRGPQTFMAIICVKPSLY